MSCAAPRCDGHGWQTVLPSYAAKHLAPQPPAEVWDRWTPDEQRTWQERNAAEAETLAKTVYPCKECNTALFFRWVGSHLESNHNRAECVDCGGRAPKDPPKDEGPPPGPTSTWGDRKDIE